MNYIQYQFTLEPLEPWREILIAKLAECNFESFEEVENGLLAYVRKDQEDKNSIEEQLLLSEEVVIQVETQEIETINWNQIWESNFHPILVNDECYIRAEFHDSKPEIPYEIIIQPKMSFGTGHHETTHLMVQYILETDCEGKSILDMGCGTSILGILTKKKGAKSVDAIDIDEWSVENSVENAIRNQVKIHVELGDANKLHDKSYDIILANINKNILISDISMYAKCLKFAGNQLIISGLLDSDFEDIEQVCLENGLKFESKKQKNEWIALKFIKS